MISRSQVFFCLFFFFFFFFFFFKCLNATIPLTYTLENDHLSSNEISKKNGTVRGDCIACDALIKLVFTHLSGRGFIFSYYQT